MHVVEVNLTEFTRRSRSVVVNHGDTDLPRGLEYGESIMVHIGGEEYRTAVVVAVEFSLTDTHYRLIIGGRVPRNLVHEHIQAKLRARQEAHVGANVAEVAGMLSEAGAHQPSSQRVAIPSQPDPSPYS